MVGLTAVTGLLLVAAWVRSARPLGTLDRIAPFLGGPLPPQSAWLFTGARLLPSRSGAAQADLPLRLARSGFIGTVAEYRLEQLTWAAAGAGCGALAAVLLAGLKPVAVIVLGITGAVIGGLARDWWLGRRARRRRERIEQQLPAVAELLAFAVSAGDTPYTALTRAAATTDGDLACEVQSVVADMRAGRSLEVSLRRLSQRVASADLDRFVDGLLLAVDRGTPVAEVMRALAADSRAASRQRLMEVAGRKDVLMLVPVVFLVLPTVIAVALLPGLQGMRVIAP